MDMKKIPKSRMEDFERRQQREREKHKRQQVQSVGREYALFPEPRRVNPSEVDDDITAKLGDHSKAIEFMTTEGVGVQPSSNNALLVSHLQSSASSSAGGNNIGNVSMSTNLLSSHRSLAGSQALQQTTQQTHHYQQPLRQQPYLKQPDNKLPYNGRGSYSAQSAKNDLRPSSGMAPPKGPPPLLPPPSGTIGGNTGNNSSLNSTSLLPPPSNGYLGPPKSTAPLHNGRFPKPLPKSINDIISKVDQTYRAPEQITKIAATPRTSIADYNLNGPNRHKYSVGPVQSILGSPPSGAELLQSAVPMPITPISALPATPNPQIISNNCGITTISSGMPAIMSGAIPSPTIGTTMLSSPLVTTAVRQGLLLSKETLKPLMDQVGPTLEKQNSTLENDLELSESDDDRRKQSRSVHNSSDSSPSDSSESGSEESSKSENHRSSLTSLQQQSSAHNPKSLTQNSLQQQQQQQPQQTAPLVGRTVANKLTNDKSKVIEPLGGSRSNIYLNSNALGSAGSSSSGPSSTSSSSNKTPSPSDSSKWNLSRYFNKKPALTQNATPPPANSLVVNSINVSMDEPTLLPGGAQIIPEATQPQPNPTIVKHENTNYGVAKKFSARSDDDDEESTGLRNCDTRSVMSNSSGAKTHISGGVPAFINEIKKEADVLYPSSLKATSSGTTQAHVHVSSQQQQTQVPLLNAAEFVAIPTSQIKHEVPGLTTVATSTVAPMSLAGGTTTVTPYNTISGNGHRRTLSASPHMRNSVSAGSVKRRVGQLSAPSSDGPTSNSSDDEDALATSTRSTVPTLGPGGTLKIPGVPAAITALPPSTSQPLASAPTVPNSITVLPINPLTKSAPLRKRKKPRNSATSITTQLDSSDEEDMTSDFKSGGVTVSPTELRAVTGPGGKLYSEPTPVVPAKKGPGRPRKTAGSGSGKKTNATPIAIPKGPKLTASKDVNSGALVAKKATTKRRASRQNSNSTGIIPMKSHSQTTQPAALTSVPIIDTSSSGSASYSTSKSSSSSSSETECEDGVISDSSSGDDNKNKVAGATKTKRNISARPTAAAVTPASTCSVAANVLPASTSRIIVQLNRRKSSHDDVPPIAISSVSTGGSAKMANSGKRKRSTSHFTQADEEADSDDESSDSGSGSYGSSVRNYNTGATAANSVTHGGNASGGSSHRSQNMQSPYKVPIPAAPVSSSTSSSSSVSSSSSSSSSGDEHFDTEPGASVSNRGKSKHSKTGTKVTTNISSGSNSSRLRRDKPKASDKNKNVTLTRIFNPEGGAKKQGQVLVIDEQQQQKLISPNASGYRTTVSASSTLSNSQENLVATATVVNSQSPRLTPGHIKSPRALPQLAAVGSHRTPDRSSRNSAERKVQQQRIRTPSCTPTRTPPTTRTPTPTPASLLSAPTASPMRTTATLLPNFPSLICKVDLSRLKRILPEWRTNTYRLSSTTISRCAQHEAILNADLQATSTITGSGNGNRTPTTPNCPTERELSHSRESLVGIGVSGSKQRLNTIHSNGRLGNLSTDGDGSGGTTPKQQPQLTPNGYNLVTNASNSSPSTKQLLKHEQLIKNEPGSELESASMASQPKADAYCSETKFKTSGSVKQELLLLKQDCKPGLTPQIAFVSADKEDDRPDGSPTSQQMRVNDITEPKSQRRKRSASSSPYKDKKRKKDKMDKYSKDGKDMKDGKESDAGSGPLLTIQDKEKDVGKSITALGAIERDIGSNAIGSGHAGVNDTCRRAIAIIPPLGMNNNGQMEKDHQMENRQLAPTNHDRLLAVRQMQQQQHLTNVAASNGSQNLANTQTASNNLNTATTADIAASNILVPPENLNAPLAPPPQAIYRSYFERDDDGLCDDIGKNSKFLQEAVKRKHAADKEQNLFNQVTLYLEAVIYFILSGAVLELHRNSEDASWVMYKDTLNLIKFISSKIKHLQVSSTSNELHEPHNKVAILSLRCQSLISLKLYKLKRNYCRNIINHCADFLKSSRMEVLNGNTPSSNSPSNSVCSQGSGSNTPPGRGMRQDIQITLNHQNLYFNYLANCHDLWDQADRLVRQGNHTDFFIALDRENGPLTLHTSMYDLFRYIQSGLKKLKSANTTTTTSATTTTNTSGCSDSVTITDNASMAYVNTTTTLSNTTPTINKSASAISSVTLQPQ